MKETDTKIDLEDRRRLAVTTQPPNQRDCENDHYTTSSPYFYNENHKDRERERETERQSER